MKKRVLSLLLCIMLIVGMVPTTAFAGATDTWAVDLVVSKNTAVQYNGQDTVEIGFAVQSDNLKLKNAQSVVLAVDLEILDFLEFNGGVKQYDPAVGGLSTNAKALATGSTHGAFWDGTPQKWAVQVNCAKSSDGKTGYMQLLVTQGDADVGVSSAQTIATVKIGFKSGKSISDLTSTSIRFINAAECATLNQSSAIEITNGAGTTQRAIMKDGSPDTLTGGFQVKWDGFTPTEPPKPAYSGTIAAPTVKTNAGGKVVLNAVTPTGGPGGETVQYGYSKTNDGKNITWQDGTTFSGLTVSSTLYFYAKVVETPSYAEKVSAASAAVTVLDKELTNLEITAQPSTKIYTHGDPFKTDGMEVKATYSDGSSNDNFTGYTVAYQTSGKGYLCKDNTKVTLNAGGKSVEVTGLTVKAKELTVTGLTAMDREYKLGDTLVNLNGGTLTGVVSGETVSLLSTPTTGRIDNAGVGNGKDVAIDPLSLAGFDSGYYTLTQPTGIKVNITRKNISGATISLGTQKTYNGSEQDVVISKVTVDGTDLTAGSDYTITSGDKATNVGDNTLVIEGKGNYKGTASAKWSLVAKDIGDTSVSITLNSASYDYTGSAITFTDYSVRDGSTVVEVKNYDATFSGNTNVGTATLTITGKGNYTGTKTANFTITAKDVSGLTATISDQTTIRGVGEFVDPVIKGVKDEVLTGTLTYAGKSHAEVVTMLAGKNANEVVTLNYTFTPTSTNYTGTKTGSFKVTVKDIEFLVGTAPATVANALDIKADPTYGDDWSKIVKIKDGVTITAKVGTNTDTDQSHFTLKQTGKPGAGSQAYTLSYNGTINGVTYSDVTVVSGTVDVAKKDVTITGLTASNKEYDGNTTATPAGTAVINGKVDNDDVAVTTGTAAFADKNVGTGKTVTFTGYSLSGTTAGNYNLKAQPASVTANITAKKVTVTGITATNRPYAKDNLEVALTGGTVSGVVSGDTVTVDLTNAKGTMTDANAGNGKAVTVTGVALGGANKGNYKLKEQPTGVTVNITKATAPTPADITVSQKYTTTNGAKAIGTVMPADAGTLTYTKGTATPTSTVTSWAVDATSGKVTYTLSGGAAGDTVTLPVIITSDNYENSTVKVVITLTAKDNQAALTLTGGTTVVYGQTLQLGTTGGNGTGTVTYAVTNGTGEATIDATGKLTPVKVGTVKVKATKAEDANYNAITSAEVEITITRATPTGAPKYTAITTSGKTLADAGLTTTGSTLTPTGGTIEWVDDTGTALLGDTKVEANKAYKWRYTPAPADAVNYAPVTGTIVVYPVSTGIVIYSPCYTIKASAGANGTISPAGWCSVVENGSQTFTFTPDKGYTVAKVLVDGKSVGAVKSYTFKNVTKDHTIEVIFMKSNGNPATGVFVMP